MARRRASAVYVLLWPAMWVQPGPTLATVFAGVLKHAGRAHPQPIYYLGELTTEDPGPGFYALTVLAKTTLLSLPLALVGTLASLTRGWRRERHVLWLVAAYGLFFFVQMSLGAKKDTRYLLPLFPALDILAAVGLVTLASRSARGKPMLAAAPMAAALALQAALVWPYHPYYVTYASPLVGGPAGAQRLLVATPENEGLDIVARYLNRQPGAERLRVGVQLPAREAFRQVFVGEVLDTREADLDYLVFADVYLTRHVAEDQWGEQWQAVRFRAPEFVARLHGIPYARLYRVGDNPQEPAMPLSLRLGHAVRLLGYTLVLGDGSVAREHAVVNPGDVLLLTLHWDALDQPDGDYSVFVHLLGPAGHLVTQQDNVPLNGTYPTLLWRTGTRVDDPYELRVPEGTPPGPYTLVAGMYDWRTGERLPVRTAEGELLAESRVSLARLDVQDERMPWWQPLAWIASGLLALAGIAVCLLQVDWRSLLRVWGRLTAALRSCALPAQPAPRVPSLGWPDGVWLVALMGVALAVRLPYLMQIPRLGDEVFEALQAWEIAYGGARPLIGVNALYGPLFAYGLALCFRLLGASPVLPRALATAAATATVGLTYLFARQRLGRRWSAALAAGLVATTPTHILVNSHLGYANSITPLFTTALLIVLVAAVQRRSGPLLVLAGFLGGLSLQTHVSVLPFLLALLMWALARRDGWRWLRTPWPYLALAAWAIAYSPVIAFNLRSGFASLREPLEHPYAYTGQVGLGRYLANLRLLAEEIGWIVDGRMSLPAEPSAFRALGAVRLVWLVAGLMLAVRRRDGLLGVMLGVTAVVIPAFNNLYTRTMGTRYIAWLLPVLCTAMAAVPEAVVRRTQGAARRIAVAALVVILVLFPLAPLGTYYASHVARQRTNSTLLRFSAAAAGLNSPTLRVLISSSTDLLYLSNAGTVQSALAYLLTLQQVPYTVVPSAELAQTLQAAPGEPLWLIAEWGEGSELAQAFRLQVVDSGIIGGEPEQRIGLFARAGR
jgi:hypothetical protein